MYKAARFCVIAIVALNAHTAWAQTQQSCLPSNSNPTNAQLYEAIACLQKLIGSPTPSPTPSPNLPSTLAGVEIHTASGGNDLCLRYDYSNSHVAALNVTDCRPQNPNQTNTKWNIELK